ncbi:MAG: hypothetical protein KGZ25_06275, partial [Planctomycetes bacterium]|nr:hypothetical protein [Planctomycetota bacterium]
VRWCCGHSGVSDWPFGGPRVYKWPFGKLREKGYVQTQALFACPDWEILSPAGKIDQHQTMKKRLLADWFDPNNCCRAVLADYSAGWDYRLDRSELQLTNFLEKRAEGALLADKYPRFGPFGQAGSDTEVRFHDGGINIGHVDGHVRNVSNWRDRRGSFDWNDRTHESFWSHYNNH